ncbi:MAG TPA: glycosyltransferase [Bryobacteraceae bacterium]|jgi:GT2 family glycosyltransferase
MPAASIIIPVYNALEFARKCLESVFRAATRIPFEVIVVDNGSSATVAAWLSEQKKRHPELTALRFDRPLGFAGAVNEGGRHARGGYVVVLNSDCAVTDGWLDGLVAVLESEPRIGIVSPVTNYCGPGVQLVAGPPATPGNLSPIQETRRLFFFCVMIRRSLWDSLSGLDEAYQVGTYEDDDFCLRARLAGWSMAVAPGVFVWNDASRTFEENRIDREEWLFRNETVFLEKASRLSRTLLPVVSDKPELPSTSVLVVALPGTSARLTDSLTSLANQTVGGFETVVACSRGKEPFIAPELERRLRIRRVAAEETSLWNTAISAAQSEYVAFLPAGDIYFPYHLEILHGSLAANQSLAAHTGWSVAIHTAGGVLRAPATTFDDMPVRLLLAPWAPLLCWMYRRPSFPGMGFREELPTFAAWDFTIRLSQSGSVCCEPSLTCERNRRPEDPHDDAYDAARVMSTFPVGELWAANERLDFLKAVRDGAWEESLLIKRREREQRARRLFRQKMAPPNPIQQALARLAAADIKKASVPGSQLADFIFLNILRWDDLTQRPHHFATGLGKRGYRVFWIDVRFLPVASFTGTVCARTLPGNVFEIQLPGLEADVYRLKWTTELLELAAGALAQVRDSAGISEAVQLVNFPGWTPLAEILRRRFGWRIIYDCLDDQYAFGELHGQDAAAYEAQLTQTGDALITSGLTLHQTKQIVREDAVFIPNAVDYGVFRAAASQGLLDHLSRPVIGFFGALADWLDSNWIAEAARRFPGWSFVFIGSEFFAREEALRRWRSATSAPNVRVLPQASLSELAGYLAQFDVCIVPFLDLAITRSMHPVKIYEYLAAGKHILAPALPELLPFAEDGLLFTYDDREESFRLLEALAAQPPTERQIADRTEFAARNDWSQRIDRLIQLVNRLPGFEA